MKAVIFKGPHNVVVDEIEEPEIQKETDAIIRVTSAGVGETDLHIYAGRVKTQPGIVLGHEIIGIVDSIGTAVQSIQEDDRVVLSLHQGGQAEYVRVPFADFNCLKLPGVAYDQWEDDFLLLSNVFPAGLHVVKLANVKVGSTVAIFGAGPLGLLSAYSSMILGASEVYVVDYIAERLEKAKEIGAIPIDFSKQDPVEQIINWRKSNTAMIASLLPGEEKMIGVMSGIDTVGCVAKDSKNPKKNNPTQVINNLINVINHAGSIAIVGFYAEAKYEIPWALFFEKGINISFGRTPAHYYNKFLRDMIITGRVKPSFIVTKHMTIDEAPQAYDNLTKQKGEYIKVILQTGLEH